jgi:cell division septation protein DedD
MRQWAVLHVRFVTFSVASLGLAACAKLAPTAAASARPEPRLGDPSVELAVTDADRLEALQGQVEALEIEIAALRKALDVMGPLTAAEDGLVAIAGADVAGEIPTTDPATEAAARLARLYAPPPSFARARSLFYEAELGAYRSRDAAEAGWRRLAGDKSLAGLNARYRVDGDQTRLIAGPLASEAAVQALCVELSAVAGQCRVAAPIRAY